MTTIRELGEKYGGIISEFVSRCDEEELNCETEKSDSEMFNGLIFSLKEGDLLTEKQAKYSCSEKLYNKMVKRAKKEFKEKIKEGSLSALKTIYNNWEEVIIDNVSCYDFWSACVNGHLEVAKWILGIKPNILPYTCHYEFPFRNACSNGRLDVAKWLLEIRPDINVRACNNFAFHFAQRNGHVEVTRWLLERLDNLSGNKSINAFKNDFYP